MTSINTSQISIFDVITKLITGSVFIILLIIAAPLNISTASLQSLPITLITFSSIPVSYLVGTALQGSSSKCFPRKLHFQEMMKKARNNIKFDDEEFQVHGGVHVHSFVWADLIYNFNLDRKFLKKSDEYGRIEREEPLIYQYICYPILSFLCSVKILSEEELNIEQTNFGAEGEAYYVLQQYAEQTNLGDVQRFQSLYVLHRSMTLSLCILIPVYVISLLISAVTEYQSLLPIEGLIPSVLGFFLLLPVFYRGMISYDKIHDTRLIYSYYVERVNDSPVSSKYILE